MAFRVIWCRPTIQPNSPIALPCCTATRKGRARQAAQVCAAQGFVGHERDARPAGKFGHEIGDAIAHDEAQTGLAQHVGGDDRVAPGRGQDQNSLGNG